MCIDMPTWFQPLTILQNKACTGRQSGDTSMPIVCFCKNLQFDLKVLYSITDATLLLVNVVLRMTQYLANNDTTIRESSHHCMGKKMKWNRTTCMDVLSNVTLTRSKYQSPKLHHPSQPMIPYYILKIYACSRIQSGMTSIIFFEYVCLLSYTCPMLQVATSFQLVYKQIPQY